MIDKKKHHASLSHHISIYVYTPMNAHRTPFKPKASPGQSLAFDSKKHPFSLTMRQPLLHVLRQELHQLLVQAPPLAEALRQLQAIIPLVEADFLQTSENGLNQFKKSHNNKNRLYLTSI